MSPDLANRTCRPEPVEGPGLVEGLFTSLLFVEPRFSAFVLWKLAKRPKTPQSGSAGRPS